jgi:hypothetical protein
LDPALSAFRKEKMKKILTAILLIGLSATGCTAADKPMRMIAVRIFFIFSSLRVRNG